MSPAKQRKTDDDFRRRTHHGTTVFEPPVDELGKTAAGKVAPVLDVATFTSAQPESGEWEAQNPFPHDDQTKHYDLTEPVNVQQLHDEIKDRAGHDLSIGVSSEFDGPISEENPGHLFVTHGVDTKVIHAAIKAHQPDANYSTDPKTKALAELRTKIANGDTLNQTETTRALALVLGVEQPKPHLIGG